MILGTDWSIGPPDAHVSLWFNLDDLFLQTFSPMIFEDVGRLSYEDSNRLGDERDVLVIFMGMDEEV